jgi:cytochrome c-type biogenesis protein CcmH
VNRRILARLAAFAILAATAPGRAGLAQEPDVPAGSVARDQAVDSSAAASVLTDPREAELDALAAEVASGLRCPVCRNQSVVESNAELSREMHRLVRERLAAGETPDEVRAYFVSRYGEWILLQPQARGINLLVYALPLLVLILGFFFARNRLRKWAASGGSRSPATAGTELGAEDEKWLREALREH